DAGLADPTARISLAETMDVGARHRGMRHPDLLVGPALLLRTGCKRLPEQRPLRAESRAAAVFQVRGHVPPLDAEVRMCPVVGREGKYLAGLHLRIVGGVLAQSGKPLRAGARAEPEQREAADKGAARDGAVNAHLRTP